MPKIRKTFSTVLSFRMRQDSKASRSAIFSISMLFAMKAFSKFFLPCTLFLAFFFLFAQVPMDLPRTKAVGARGRPPVKKTYCVNDFGATADTTKVVTQIIQQAIDRCAKESGGIVAFRPGVYLMGSVF